MIRPAARPAGGRGPSSGGSGPTAGGAGLCARGTGLAASALILLSLASAPPAAGAPPASGQRTLSVLASFLPMYVFARNVAGDAPGVRVDIMLPADLGCPHDYALTPGDMKKIAAADLFVANGYGMEEFLGAPVRKANPRIAIVETARGVDPIRAPGARRHGGDAADDDLNPHTWVSPRNAILQVRAIERALAAASPGNGSLFRKNADAYVARLSALAAEFDAAKDGFRQRNIVTFHDVFDYLARDLGLSVVGRIEETPGQEPAAGAIDRLIRTIRERQAAAVFAEPQYPERLAAIVAREAGVPLRILDPVSTGPADLRVYEEAMRRNLRTLMEVLGSR